MRGPRDPSSDGSVRSGGSVRFHPGPTGYRASVCRRACSTLAIGELPTTRWISVWVTVARLSVIATMTCERPVPRSSAWTTRTGRSLAVLRLESGKRTRATSPRLQPGPRGIVVVIDVHLHTIPIRGESREPGSQLRRVRLIDPVRPEVDAVRLQEGHQDRHFLAHVVRPLGQLDLALSVDAFDRPQHAPACYHLVPCGRTLPAAVLRLPVQAGRRAEPRQRARSSLRANPVARGTICLPGGPAGQGRPVPQNPINRGLCPCSTVSRTSSRTSSAA